MSKEILILVHPDDVVMNGVESAREYLKKLKQHIPKFKTVITHLLYSDTWGGWSKEPELTQVWEDIRSYLKENTNAIFVISIWVKVHSILNYQTK